jgi:hypothetical protein
LAAKDLAQLRDAMQKSPAAQVDTSHAQYSFRVDSHAGTVQVDVEGLIVKEKEAASPRTARKTFTVELENDKMILYLGELK